MMDNIVNLEGIVEFNIEKNGVLLDRFVDKNLIVITGRQLICKLLGLNDVDRRITQIGFGENGTAPQLGDESLSQAFIKSIGISNPLTQVSFPEDRTSVIFPWELLQNEGNGNGGASRTYSEIGLLTGAAANNVLFARKTFAPREKNSEIRFFGSWTIKF